MSIDYTSQLMTIFGFNTREDSMSRFCQLLLMLSFTGVLLAAGCADADRGPRSSSGDMHLVELYSGGTKVREWQAAGKVSAEENRRGFSFKDAESGQLVRISGDVVVTQLLRSSENATPAESKPNTTYDGIPPDVDAGKVINGNPNPFHDVKEDKSL